ncbi:hypothetical protein [Salibacterium halotolerans]|uniref:Uncharacterized protein n=1 Tax=Salibacterium halotolerans TaxID=1884432 RepID=A0A1I5S5Y1_9BACI|nr:hypothetical protein [Salibacterium halotolerans]SFP66051.1 hypothetical protein SAMN05518683_10859 [Salibacterium halotolerans]
MIWTIWQTLTLIILGVCTYFSVQFMIPPPETATGSSGPVLSVFDSLLAVTVPLTAFYFLILFELNKENHFFYRSIWKRAPFFIGIVGALSLIALFVLFFAFSWMPAFCVVILLYQYFLLIFFLWVFAVFFNRMKQNDTVTKAGEQAATYSVWGILVMFLLAYFAVSPI